MQTSAQLRAEFYNALINNTNITDIIGNRLYWIGRITVENEFPLITYAKYDTAGDYSFGLSQEKEDVVFETRIYSDNISETDTLFEEIRQSLLAIGYRNINSPAEFLEENINKRVSVIRWEKVNT